VGLVAGQAIAAAEPLDLALREVLLAAQHFELRARSSAA
jgi:hypothetical protein